MAIRTSIKLTGTVGLVALLFWIFLQFIISAEGTLKLISGIVFIVAFIMVIIDSAKGGFTD